MYHLREAWLGVCEAVEALAISNGWLFNQGLRSLSEEKLSRIGKKRAKLAAERAWRSVPAYRKFLRDNGLEDASIRLEQLPLMSKSTYISAFPTAERCSNGTFMVPGVGIDESSGSTGQPYNWVRGKAERKKMRAEMARMVDWIIGSKPRIAINGFSMGAWATGVNVGEALEDHSIVKSTGPDLDKIISTIKFFGSEPGYILCGYPPFLKLLLDTMKREGFEIEEFELHGIVGGEGMSEDFRRYLLANGFTSCYSGYGASDLDMSIAFESPESIAIRGLLLDDRDFRSEVLDGDHRVPMVFQYNPLNCHLETTEEGDLVATLNYSRTLSPRIRYNIGDEAKIFGRSRILKLVEQAGHKLSIDPAKCLPMPYLFLFGRRDHTISVMGANIYPEDIEHVLFELEETASGYKTFQVQVVDGDHGTVHPRLHVEWSDQAVPELDCEALARKIEERLRALNADFQNAWNEYADALRFEVEVHPRGAGPFQGQQQRIKNRYVVKE